MNYYGKLAKHNGLQERKERGEGAKQYSAAYTKYN